MAGYGFVALSVVTFGLGPILGRLAYDSGAGGPTVLAFRTLVAALLLFAWFRMRGVRLALPAGTRLGAALLGITLGLMAYGYVGSVRFIPVPLATLLFFTNPFLAVILARLVDKDPLTPQRMGAVALALAGLVLTLGVQTENMAPRVADSLGLDPDQDHVFVRYADPNGPAAQSGICSSKRPRSGDTIDNFVPFV